MIATIRALTGRDPRKYFGDSANPVRCGSALLRMRQDASFGAAW